MTEIIQFTGILTAFLLLCGIVKFYIYYKKFGITILRFIEIEEILTLFMDNLIAYLAIIIPTTFYVFLFSSNFKLDLWDRLILHLENVLLKWPLILTFIICCSAGVIFFKIKRSGVNNRDLVLLIFLILFCAIPFPVIYKLFLDFNLLNLNTESTINGAYLLLTSLLLLGYSILTALNEARKVLKKHYYVGTKIYLKSSNSCIESTGTIFFIGMTKSYIFVYDKTNKISIVLKVEDVEKIEFPNRRP